MATAIAWPRFEKDAPCVGMKEPEKQCPFYSECPYFQARERARKAPVVATNYSYGFEALANPEILDQFDSLVADEAHDLSSILTAAATLPLELGRLKDSLIECLQGGYQALWEAAQPIRTGSCCLLRCRRCWPSRDWPG